ncbi:MAG: hypothetical protein HKN20_09535, partial [Gemmatimonadetes bacterium]|nr:hypothetical protein [Gemmatimonadota bacterium]
MRIPKPNLPPVLKDVADAAAEIGGRTQNDSPNPNGAAGSKTADALRKSRESSVGRLLSGNAAGAAVLPALPKALKAPTQALSRSTSALLEAVKAGADPPKLDELMQRTIGTAHETLSAVMDHARSPRIANRDRMQDFMKEYGTKIDEFQERIGEIKNRPEMAVVGVAVAIVTVVVAMVFAVCTWGSGAQLAPPVVDAVSKSVGRSLELGFTTMRNAKEFLERSGRPSP